MKTLLVIIVTAIISLHSFGQKSSGIDSVKILTSVQCEMCVERVTETLAFEKGVKSVDVDLDTKYVTVGFKSNKTTADKIRQAIAKVGYDADEVIADKKAYAKLPACCKNPDDPNHTKH
jgi:periplasmic mercuric ion binding protein